MVDLIFAFAVDSCDGGQGRDDLHNGGGWAARDCLCAEVQENCLEDFFWQTKRSFKFDRFDKIRSVT